jgi:hypothetical protein
MKWTTNLAAKIDTRKEEAPPSFEIANPSMAQKAWKAMYHYELLYPKTYLYSPQLININDES